MKRLILVISLLLCFATVSFGEELTTNEELTAAYMLKNKTFKNLPKKVKSFFQIITPSGDKHIVIFYEDGGDKVAFLYNNNKAYMVTHEAGLTLLQILLTQKVMDILRK